MRTLINRLLAIILFIFLLPLIVISCLLVILTTHDLTPIFIQKRLGKDKNIFFIYKIKTMIRGADALKKKYLHLNEYFPPIFKIHNDPRYTNIGKILAQFHIDELPQLINIMKGEMTWIGPRPLPVEEAIQVPNKYENRFHVLPGLIPPSIVEEKDALKTIRWLEIDREYAEKKSVGYDLQLFFKLLQKIMKIK